MNLDYRCIEDEHESESDSGISFVDDDGERKLPISSTSAGRGESCLSVSEDKSSSKISNYSELFGSWVSQDTRSRFSSLVSSALSANDFVETYTSVGS